jgi:hypothetical protein
MNVASKVCLVLLWLGLVATSADAQGTNTFDSGFPKPGTATGAILIQGKVVPDAGWTVVGSGTAYVWPVGSGQKKSFSVIVGKAGNWGPKDLNGFDSNTEYWIQVDANVKMGVNVVPVSTDPMKSFPK